MAEKNDCRLSFCIRKIVEINGLVGNTHKDAAMSSP